MENIFFYLSLGFAMIFVIEGLLYAIFPRHIQNLMVMAVQMDSEKLRYIGGILLTVGVFAIVIILK